MITIKTLEDSSFEMLYEAFSQAFSDYDAPYISKQALAVMLERRGFSPKHSFGAFDGEKLVSFTFNGIGEHKGISTAYDTGTGTIKEYRGRKLAGKIFETSIPFLKEKGIKQYLLEVIQKNIAAYNIYKNQGFDISREFNYYFIDSDKIKPTENTRQQAYKIKELSIASLIGISSFWDIEPSWQNSIPSIRRRANDFKILGCYNEDKLVGYGIIDPNSGDITQLAIDNKERRKGLATSLMHELVKLNKYPTLKILNTEKGYLPMEKFIEKYGIPLAGLQYEMIKKL